jgi:hypothetical protein
MRVWNEASDLTSRRNFVLVQSGGKCMRGLDRDREFGIGDPRSRAVAYNFFRGCAVAYNKTEWGFDLDVRFDRGGKLGVVFDRSIDRSGLGWWKPINLQGVHDHRNLQPGHLVCSNPRYFAHACVCSACAEWELTGWYLP